MVRSLVDWRGHVRPKNSGVEATSIALFCLDGHSSIFSETSTRTPKRTRLKQATSMMDIYPTILSQAGVSPDKFSANMNGEPNEIDGRDITALLNEGAKENPSVPSPHEFMFILLQQSASTVKKVSLELGGLAPFIVFESADLATAAKALIAAKFRNTGQTCIAANNVFVHRSVMSEFIEIFKFEIARLKFGDVFDSSTTVGKIKKMP
jgi:hypothetical protein